MTTINPVGNNSILIKVKTSEDGPFFGFSGNGTLIESTIPSTGNLMGFKIIGCGTTIQMDFVVRFNKPIDTILTETHTWYIIKPDTEEYIIFKGNYIIDPDDKRCIIMPLLHNQYVDSWHSDTSNSSFITGSLRSSNIIVALFPDEQYKPY